MYPLLSQMATKYISLGATCAPTYWLNQLGLRTQAYPFDWTKNTLSQLINVLESDFKDYAESITLSQFSEKHPLEVGNDDGISGSYIIKNNYGITFAHELVNASETNTFTETLARRIGRFRELYEECERQITFLLYVPSVIKQSFWKHLEKLASLLPQNSVIYVIIHKDSCTPTTSIKENNDIRLIYFDSFEEDWRAPEAFKKVRNVLAMDNKTSS